MPNAASRWRRSSGKLEALGISAERKSIYRDIRGAARVRRETCAPARAGGVRRGAPRVRVRLVAAAGGRGAGFPLPHAA